MEKVVKYYRVIVHEIDYVVVEAKNEREAKKQAKEIAKEFMNVNHSEIDAEITKEEYLRETE